MLDFNAARLKAISYLSFLPKIMGKFLNLSRQASNYLWFIR